ncbi:hypothetical protein AN403_5955 [Pseudomonas fluorescens]|uniref:Uncharacterized protein n=1 Tax=Pseudomonas fluorescens TaxID=294 RepID=A0A0P8X7C0_PSEFL|nr:hypothetical protein AN403_5955 [Pseudomonas fluorescens]
MISIHTIERRTAGARGTLVAIGISGRIAKVSATRALHEVAANRCHVAQLRRCSTPQRLT